MAYIIEHSLYKRERERERERCQGLIKECHLTVCPLVRQSSRYNLCCLFRGWDINPRYLFIT